MCGSLPAGRIIPAGKPEPTGRIIPARDEPKRDTKDAKR